MILALLACSGDPEPMPDHDSADHGTGGHDSGGHGTDTRGPLPLARLTEAEDLDPADGVVHVALTAAATTHTFIDLSGTEHAVEGFAYNGLLGGPLIRATLGDTLTVDFTNKLDEPTTIHWHGLDVPFEMDGVTWMMDPIEPGGTFTYTFPLEQAGTFWYHPHFNSEEQVSGGLYGVIVVADPADPPVDEDLVLLIDDWPLDVGAMTGHHDTGGGMSATMSEPEEHDEHSAAEGTWTVNGQLQPTLTLSGGSTLRLRILNVSSHGYLDLTWPDMRQLAGDQGLSALLRPEHITLTSGDRVEAEWLIGESGFTLDDLPYVHQGGASWEARETLLTVEVTDPAAAPAGADWPFPDTSPSEDPGHTDITYVFSGAPETGVWMMNGAVFPDVDIDEVAYGDSAIIEVRNISPAEHPYHLHGMPFEVLSVDGVAPGYRQLEDTINVGVYGTVRLRIEANNPGDWMSHCHILHHAEGGMMTVLRVTDPQ